MLYTFQKTLTDFKAITSISYIFLVLGNLGNHIKSSLHIHACNLRNHIHTDVHAYTWKSEQAYLYLVFEGGSSVSLHCLRRKQQRCFVLPQTTGRCL